MGGFGVHLKRRLVSLTTIATTLLLLVAIASVSVGLIYADGGTFPKTVAVPDGKGGYRVDVVDRPSNATAGAPGRALQLALERKARAASGQMSPLAPGTDYTPPTTIKVGIRPNNDPGQPIQSVNEITFYDASGNSDYVQNVLPNEWVCSWPDQSLRTGAMAVKMYGWYHTMDPKYPAQGADVDNTTNSQVYRPSSWNPSCTSAIRAIDHQGFRRNFAGANPYVFETAYCAGTYGDDRSVPCSGYQVGDSLSQNGSHYWADQGYGYQWILQGYYRPPANTTQEFFSY